MVINVSEALDSDTAEQIVVERTNGKYVNGIFQKESPLITFKALASSQQPTPQQIQTLPEGERNNNPRLFICNKPLRTTSDKDGTIADKITFKGKIFKIIQLGDWTSYGHTMAFGTRDQ